MNKLVLCITTAAFLLPSASQAIWKDAKCRQEIAKLNQMAAGAAKTALAEQIKANCPPGRIGVLATPPSKALIQSLGQPPIVEPMGGDPVPPLPQFVPPQPDAPSDDEGDMFGGMFDEDSDEVPPPQPDAPSDDEGDMFGGMFDESSDEVPPPQPDAPSDIESSDDESNDEDSWQSDTSSDEDINITGAEFNAAIDAYYHGDRTVTIGDRQYRVIKAGEVDGDGNIIEEETDRRVTGLTFQVREQRVDDQSRYYISSYFGRFGLGGTLAILLEPID